MPLLVLSPTAIIYRMAYFYFCPAGVSTYAVAAQLWDPGIYLFTTHPPFKVKQPLQKILSK